MSPVTLATTDLGDGSPVIVVHGLFGRRRNWQGIQKRLSEHARIITADIRNHGDSPWSDEMTYEAMAVDIAKLIDDTGKGPAIIVGHSMGGKAAMTLALSQPHLVKGLMVLDIAPVPYTHNYAPYISAMRAVPLDSLERRTLADQHLKSEISDPAIRAFLLQNLVQDEAGLRWQVNLNSIEASMDAILGFPTTAEQVFEGPTQFVAGGASDYISESAKPVIDALFPRAEYTQIEGAGHWVHAEKPAEVIDCIQEFIASIT